MSHQTSALPIAYVFLRILIILNWLSGIGIFVLLVATVVARDWTFRALGVTGDTGIPQMIIGLQAIAALGLIAVVLGNFVLKRLLAIVETVKIGDPFVAANAFRLHTIAWLLLAMQILSVIIGLIGKAISTPQNPVHLDAGISPMGWLAVLLTFVLARVFAEGTLMREDLEGTI